MAIDAALAKVRETGNLPVPLHLRNAPTSLMKNIGYGKDYKYAHDYPGNFVHQQYMPDQLNDTTRFWNACDNPQEAQMRQRQIQRWGK